MDHMKKLKNKAFGRDFERLGNEIDLASLKGWEDREVDNVKSQEMVWSSPLAAVCSLWLEAYKDEVYRSSPS